MLLHELGNKTKKALTAVDDFITDKAVAFYAYIGAAGDLFTVASGFVFENFGRMVSGTFGAVGFAPMIFLKKKTLQEGEIDPQDELAKLSPLKKFIHGFNFKKYPVEFQANVTLLQNVGLTFLSGPDTASKVGEATGNEGLISNDSFRPFETIFGTWGLVAPVLTSMVHEAQNPTPDQRPKGTNPLPKIRYDFNAAGGFIKDRAQEFVSQGYRIDKGINEAALGAYTSISNAGPNKVISRSFNYVLFPWMIESGARGDVNNVLAGSVYALANYAFGKVSKRSEQEKPAEPAPAP